jgi:hypothetical protein
MPDAWPDEREKGEDLRVRAPQNPTLHQRRIDSQLVYKRDAGKRNVWHLDSASGEIPGFGQTIFIRESPSMFDSKNDRVRILVPSSRPKKWRHVATIILSPLGRTHGYGFPRKTPDLLLVRSNRSQTRLRIVFLKGRIGLAGPMFVLFVGGRLDAQIRKLQSEAIVHSASS